MVTEPTRRGFGRQVIQQANRAGSRGTRDQWGPPYLPAISCASSAGLQSPPRHVSQAI